jgi:hypothetical protein
MIRDMRRSIALLALSLVEGLLLAGCSSSSSNAGDEEWKKEDKNPLRAATVSTVPSAGSPSASRDAKDLEPWNGQAISLEGIFESDRAIHGVVKLASGLRVWLVHFDHIRRGDDWLAYVGKPCVAYGVLHTYTRDVDGYRHPRLEVKEFSGSRE